MTVNDVFGLAVERGYFTSIRSVACGGLRWPAVDDEISGARLHPCSGALLDAGRSAVIDALGRLLGPARAAVLVLLDTGRSTSQLVAFTGQGQGPGSVGRHLKVLLDARLVRRRRAGRSVLYYRTPAGEVLVKAQVTE